MLDNLLEIGVERTILVVGHGASAVRAAIGTQYQHMPIEYIENPDYRTTNNIYSLALAAEKLCADDTILIESDLIVDCGILHACAGSPSPAIATVARYEPWMDGTVTLLDPQGAVIRFVSKHEIDHAQIASYYKTVNIYKLSAAFSRNCFVPQLHAQISAIGHHAYYEVVFGQIVRQALAPIQALVVSDARWYEIDTLDDLRSAETLFPELASTIRDENTKC
jgi:choline kinase